MRHLDERKTCQTIRDARMTNPLYKVHNPHNKPVEELPIIYGFDNGGTSQLRCGEILAEDGTPLGSHASSNEGWLLIDLGILNAGRPSRHASFELHYPDGYRTEFVRYDDVADHVGLQQAINKWRVT